MAVSIEARGLFKRYGRTVAVDGLSFTVEPGRVTGFVGPNGAGKSTTLRLILGLDRPDEGSARIGGRAYRDLHRPLCHVGALLDPAALHPRRRARAHLLWLARSNGLPARRVDEILEQVGLGSAARKRTGGYSLGMRARLGIAAALLGDPPVLLLDEPVNGLDVEGIAWIRQLLRSLAGEGRTVFVSSHLMGELEGTADHVIVIGRGRLLADTSVDDLRVRASTGRVALRTEQRPEVMALLAGEGATVTMTGGDQLTVDGLPAARVAALLTEASLAFSEVSSHRASLEEAYMGLTRDFVEFGVPTVTTEGGA
jgi:ABC-2 type transport system ATP-binding protein